MERDFAAYLFTLFCPLFTSGASFSIAHEYSVRNLNNRKQGHSATWIKCQNCFIISFTNVTNRAYHITENFQYATCHFYRTTLCVSAVFAIAGVRPSVCLSRSCIVSRRLKILSSSSFFLGPVAYYSSFLTQNDNTHLQVEPL